MKNYILDTPIQNPGWNPAPPTLAILIDHFLTSRKLLWGHTSIITRWIVIGQCYMDYGQFNATWIMTGLDNATWIMTGLDNHD